jgi:3-deoxy-D-manno-octulosonic-acid transferase
MLLFYNIGIFLFRMCVGIASLFNARAAYLQKGWQSNWDQLKKADLTGEVIWVHCASLGEFEQGRPVIEAIRKERPECRIVLTFFSPSGYEVRKNYALADVVVYLPADTQSNARRFIRAINPKMVFFVKYEYWFHYFRELKRMNVPLYSISSIFREGQIFFKWYGGWFRKILGFVTRFYVQDERSGNLLRSIGLNDYIVAGDTRFDRVRAIVSAAVDVPVAAAFSEGVKVLVAGSTWPDDEAILASFINKIPAKVRIIIAPHEVHESHITQLEKRFNVPVARYSKLNGALPSHETRVLIIDTIGLLSSVYRYGSIAYIGGGFGKGIHNTLEAATYGMPVVFGPNYRKFKEAVDLIETGGGFSIKSEGDFLKVITSLWFGESDNALVASGQASKEYVESMCGATPLILNELIER